MTTSESLFWAREGGYVKRLLATVSAEEASLHEADSRGRVTT
jgi:hypothetical protein